ncbi:UDP-N-acetylglucosamine transferase subunit ALG13-like protein [Bienertia sinuspersici]
MFGFAWPIQNATSVLEVSVASSVILLLERLLPQGLTFVFLIYMESHGDDGSIAVDYFTFSSSIAESLRSASLVISHAGSGSIFETLRLRKPLIVVVNEDLMDNHQVELAEELAERKHLFCARPQTLNQTIASINLDSLLPYPAGDAKPVANLINKFLGFPED